MPPSAVVCAYSPVGREALAGLLDAGVTVSALFTYEPAGDESWFEPPEALARRRGIPVFKEAHFNTDETLARIAAAAPDFLFSFYFREMIQARVLELPRLGAYNLHGSLLPRYRGRAPINWVLVHGETETGITLHAMTPRPDDGDVIAQARLPVAWDETPLSLTLRAAEAGRRLVREALPGLLDRSAPRTPQRTLGTATYFGGRRPEDSRLDFAMTAREAFNQVRAVADPWPNAFLESPAGRLRIPWALPAAAPCPPGRFRETQEGVLLGFSDAALRLVVLAREGARSLRPTEQATWLRQLGIPEAQS